MPSPHYAARSRRRTRLGRTRTHCRRMGTRLGRRGPAAEHGRQRQRNVDAGRQVLAPTGRPLPVASHLARRTAQQLRGKIGTARSGTRRRLPEIPARRHGSTADTGKLAAGESRLAAKEASLVESCGISGFSAILHRIGKVVKINKKRVDKPPDFPLSSSPTSLVAFGKVIWLIRTSATWAPPGPWVHHKKGPTFSLFCPRQLVGHLGRSPALFLATDRNDKPASFPKQVGP